MNNTAKILTAAAVGLAAGGILGILFAPKKGKDTRKDIADKSNDLLDKFKRMSGKDQLKRMKGKLEGVLDKVNDKIETYSENGAVTS